MVAQLLKNSPLFVKPEVFLSCLQGPATGRYFKIIIIIIIITII
jgi:hypothetical protein